MFRVLARIAVPVVAGLVAAASNAPAQAVDQPSPDLPATFSAEPLPTWQTNGTVWALATIGSVVYVGGTFTSVRPPAAPEGTGEVPRNNLAAFDAVTGALLPCDPSLTHTVAAPKVLALAASPTGDRLYVGGIFNRVGSTAVSNLAAITPGCAVVATTTFRRPAVMAAVRAISAASTGVYAGGDFNTVDGQARTKYAAFTPNGVLRPATVTLDGKVNAVLAAADVGKVLVGGDFGNVNGIAERGLVALDPLTSDVVQTFPGWVPGGSAVKALARDETGFYVGNEGTGFGMFDGRIAGELATGSMRWKDYCLGATQALAVHEGVLYGGHHSHECSTTPGGWLEDGIRNHLTAQDVRTREIVPTFFPDTNDGVGPAPQGPRALVVAQQTLWVGGEFSDVNAVPQRGLTRFRSADTMTASPPAPTATSLRAGENLVSWVAGFDRDADALTYEVYRDGALVHSVTARSRDWSRRTLSFVDTGVAGGQVARYRIRVVEPDSGNVSPKGPEAVVTTSTHDVGYAGTVLADDPSIYWPLDETVEQGAGTRTGEPYLRARVHDLSGAALEGTAERGYASTGGFALGGPSALQPATGTSVTFDGTTGRIASSYTNDFAPALEAPGSYSLELWFRTAGAKGGRLIGFSNRRTELYERVQPGSGLPVYLNSLSSAEDRVVYLTDTGQLVFGTQGASGKVVATSARTFNDSAWHQVVATQGPAGMRLYADGLLVASSPSAQSSSWAGWWKVGYDALSGWPSKPAVTALKGGVDEVAVYPRALDAEAVVRHYLAGRPSATIDVQPPTPPQDLTADRSGTSTALAWSPATDDMGVTGYEIYRTATAEEPLVADAQVGSGTRTTFSEAGVPQGVWFYRVIAVDAAGNRSVGSAAASVVVPAPAATVTMGSSADTFVNSALKTSSSGTTKNVIVDSTPEQIAYLRFALPSAPAGQVLTSAVLRLRTYPTSSSGSVDPHSVRGVNGAWTESVTWNTRPALAPSVLGEIPAGTKPDTWYDVPLTTAQVRDALGSNLDLALAPGGADSLLFYTREASTSLRPQLVLGFDSP